MIDFYNAFISYKHAPLDIKIASHVQKQLEHFHVPGSLKGKIQHRKITRIFRDKDELPITSDLTETLTNALEKSEYLIVICSTNTKESMWVKREIQTFLKTHTKDKIFTVLCDGEPQDVIPEELLTTEKEIIDSNGFTHLVNVPVEPLSCDYRMPMSRADKEELPRLAAGLLGCSYDELQRRRRQYRLKRATAIVAAAFAGVLAFGGYMLYSRMQINKAYMESLRTRSVFLANESQQLLDNGKRADALHLALASLPSDKKDKKPVTAPAIRAITDATSAYRSRGGLNFTPEWNYKSRFSITESVLSEDESYLAAVDNAGNTYCWDTLSHKLLFELPCKEKPETIKIPNQETLVIIYPHAIEAYNLPSGTSMWKYESPTVLFDDRVSFSSNDIFVFAGKTSIDRISSRDGQIKETYVVKKETFVDSISQVAASSDGTLVAYTDASFMPAEDDDVHIYDPGTKNDRHFHIDSKYIELISFVDDKTLGVIHSNDLFQSSFTLNSTTVIKPAVKTFTFYNTGTGKQWSADLVYTDVSLGSGILALPSRNAVLCYTGNAVGIYDLDTGTELNKYTTSSSVITTGDYDKNGLPEFILRHGEYVFCTGANNNNLQSFPMRGNNIVSGAIGSVLYIVSKDDTDVISYDRILQDDEWTAVKLPDDRTGTGSQAFETDDDYLVTASLITEEVGEMEYETYVRIIIVDLNTGKQIYTEDLRDVNVSVANYNLENIDGKFYLTLQDDMLRIDPKKKTITPSNLELDYSDIRSNGKIISRIKDYSTDKFTVVFCNYDGKDKEELYIPEIKNSDVTYDGYHAVYNRSLDMAFLSVGDTVYAVDLSSMDYEKLDLPDEWDFSNRKNFYVTTSEDKSRILFSDGNTVLVTDKDLKEEYTIVRNGISVECAIFKDNYIYIAGDGYISEYDSKTGKLLRMSEMTYATEMSHSKAWFEDNGRLLNIQSDDRLFIIDTESLYEITYIEQIYCYHKETNRYYLYSYTASSIVTVGYVRRYSVEDLIEKGKIILQNNPLDDATRTKYGL